LTGVDSGCGLCTAGSRTHLHARGPSRAGHRKRAKGPKIEATSRPVQTESSRLFRMRPLGSPCNRSALVCQARALFELSATAIGGADPRARGACLNITGIRGVPGCGGTRSEGKPPSKAFNACEAFKLHGSVRVTFGCAGWPAAGWDSWRFRRQLRLDRALVPSGRTRGAHFPSFSLATNELGRNKETRPLTSGNVSHRSAALGDHAGRWILRQDPVSGGMFWR